MCLEFVLTWGMFLSSLVSIKACPTWHETITLFGQIKGFSSVFKVISVHTTGGLSYIPTFDILHQHSPTHWQIDNFVTIIYGALARYWLDFMLWRYSCAFARLPQLSEGLVTVLTWCSWSIRKSGYYNSGDFKIYINILYIYKLLNNAKRNASYLFV